MLGRVNLSHACVKRSRALQIEPAVVMRGCRDGRHGDLVHPCGRLHDIVVSPNTTFYMGCRCTVMWLTVVSGVSFWVYLQ